MSVKTTRKTFFAGVGLMVLGGISTALWWRSVAPLDEMANYGQGERNPPRVETRTDRATAQISVPGVGADEARSSAVLARNATAQEAAAPAMDAPVAEARIREMMRRDFDGLVETRRPDGGYSLSLEGRFRHLSVRVPGAEDGAEIVRCFCDADALLTALHSGHSSAPAASGEAAAGRHSLSR